MFNRDKQIEIARELCPFSQEYESCSKCNTELDIDGEPCIYMIMAKHIIDKGYRKASELVKEIFAEIEKTIKDAIRICNRYAVIPMLREAKMSCYKDMLGYIEKLKKKYESEGEG